MRRHFSNEKPDVEVSHYYPGFSDAEFPRVRTECRVNTQGQRWGIDVPFEVAEELALKLLDKVAEIRDELLPEDTPEARAIRRDDFLVSVRQVRCADADCKERFVPADSDDRHPWIAARDTGWMMLKDSTDLVCPGTALQYPEMLAVPLRASPGPHH